MLNSPRKNTKLYKLIKEMVCSLRTWRYMEMAEFGFKQNHTREFDKKADRGYWSVNIRHAIQSGYIYKHKDGSWSVTTKCFQDMVNE